jgi:hypothetical protein
MRDEYGIQPDGMHAICQSTSQDKINYSHVSRSVELAAGIFFSSKRSCRFISAVMKNCGK